MFRIQHSAPLIDDSANDIDGGLDKKTAPIPFLIRNTTADGMPISIGSLRAVNTPAFSSFNPFIKRLPPPKKYVFEPRQVLPGDVVDPYNYLRALFRGEVILTSNKLPTFASPRVWGMTTASTLSKAPTAMYTTRSPQGFNPWMFKKDKTTTRTTTTARPKPFSFFGNNIDLSNKGMSDDVEHVPLPVGMLGTPAPDFKSFNFKDFVEKMKRKKAMGGQIEIPASGNDSRNKINSFNSFVNNNKAPETTTVNSRKKINTFKSFLNNKQDLETTTIKSSAIDTFVKNIKNKNLATMEDVTKTQNTESKMPTLQSVVMNLKNKNIPTLDDIMRKFNKPSSFHPIPAVPSNKVTLDNKFLQMSEAVPSNPAAGDIKFLALPAVPTDQEKTNTFPSFQNFPSSTTERQLQEARQGKEIEFHSRMMADHSKRTFALQKLKNLLNPVSSVVDNDPEVIVKNNPDRFKTPFSPSTQRSIEKLQQLRTTTSRPRSKLPHGTVRSEIMSILKQHTQSTTTKTSTISKEIEFKTTMRPQLFELLQLKSSQFTTQPPKIQQTTSRAEVLALLQQFLQSVKPATTPTTPTTITTTTKTTIATTSATQKLQALLNLSSRNFKSPSLRFDDPQEPIQPRINIDLTSVAPPKYQVTTVSPVNPRSPFPNMEPPPHDVIKSNIYLSNPMDAIVQTSTVHPMSPFQHLEPPGPANGAIKFSENEINFFPTPGGNNPGLLLRNKAIPRSDPGMGMLPFDPAR